MSSLCNFCTLLNRLELIWLYLNEIVTNKPVLVTTSFLRTPMNANYNLKFGDYSYRNPMLIDPRNQREVVEIKPRLQWREAIKQGAILNSY